MFRLVDTHCHLDFPDFNDDREFLIKKTLELGIRMITIGADSRSSAKAFEIALAHEGVYAAIGIHPHNVSIDKIPDNFFEMAKNEKVVGIGECGLDFYGENINKKDQEKLFIQQIELAVFAGKPLIVHSRDSYGETFDILEKYTGKLKGVSIHSFTGCYDEAEKFLDIGCFMGFTGVITYKPRKEKKPGDSDPMLLHAVGKIPLDKILIETDAPFLAPAPYRGRRCEPAHVEEIAKKIAEIKNISFEEVAHKTTENAVSLFNIKTA